VKGSELAQRDSDVRGRAVEGVGLAQEALGNTDAALKSFRELENSGISGFGVLGIYHQARVHYAKGDVEKAKELLATARKKLDEKAKDKPRVPGMPPGFLEASVRDLLTVVDPSAAAAMLAPSGVDPALLEKLRGESGGKISPEKLQELLRTLGAPAAPGEAGEEGAPAEAPAGDAPPPEAPASAEAPPAEKAPEKPAENKAPAKKPTPAPQGQAPAAPAPEAPPAAPEPAPAPAAPAPAEGSGAP
jgi:hypothetical protein